MLYHKLHWEDGGGIFTGGRPWPPLRTAPGPGECPDGMFRGTNVLALDPDMQRKLDKPRSDIHLRGQERRWSGRVVSRLRGLNVHDRATRYR